jgi:tRNA-2-methylthio-N6-dimethylallyladenosine synthase
VEGHSKKSKDFFYGRTSQNKIVVFPVSENVKIGQYIYTKIHDCTQGTLIGNIIEL